MPNLNMIYIRSLFLGSILAGFIFYSFTNVSRNSKESSTDFDSDTVQIIKGVFDIPELKILASPDSEHSITFPKSEKVIDYDVSPKGGEVAAIVSKSERENSLRIWEIGKNELSDSFKLPENLQAKAIAWHPNANVLFIMGVISGKHQIFRVSRIGKEWSIKSIFSSPNPLRILVICPRPFIVSSDYSMVNNVKDYYTYRLFFGMDNGDKTFRTVSVTETGRKFYQVIGPLKTFTKAPEGEAEPSKMESVWALPIAFHPAGHQLIWQDQQNNFNLAIYNSKEWGGSKPLNIALPGNGTITPTPNGLGLIHWQNNKAGIGIYLFASKKEENQLQNCHFISTPSSTPDGKGIVGLTLSEGTYSLKYLPISVPLPDVVNAWMYNSSKEEMSLFQKNLGLFRPNQFDQIYSLYDTENYYCGGYNRNSPTRPYLVTTDIFWELFGAAYQGVFIVKEREEAMPDFWKFINEGFAYLKKSKSNSSWTSVFAVLQDLDKGNLQNSETRRIIEEKDCNSPISGDQYSFSDLKPRGHYSSSPEMMKYFRAFRYFTTIYKEPQKIEELNTLPENIKSFAEKWITSYSGFISPSRAPLVWNNLKITIPDYCQYPQKEPTIFPLSWGFDNEILFSTVYHPKLPLEKQIIGPGGMRVLPSGIDIAAALGNNFADNLMESDYQKYPPLRKVIQSLKSNYQEKAGNSMSDNLYHKWMKAIAIQWMDTLNSTNGKKDRDIWQTKRLQTGLATWATLRHATVLVNERTVAECGEGGFEEILMRAPRGYVEPDPYTFAAIADLFDAAAKHVPKSIMANKDIKNDDGELKSKKSLYDGIVSRLKETADEARAFQAMAEKERRGEPLSNEENLKVLYVAGTAEHNFLVFNSLANKEYALSNPDPIGKITDVAGGSGFPYLMAAVGNTMEWNQIVPFYGRHEIVKGSVYSYYEFESNKLLNDLEWRGKANKQEFLPWIKNFITNQKADGVAQTSY